MVIFLMHENRAFNSVFVFDKNALRIKFIPDIQNRKWF